MAASNEKRVRVEFFSKIIARVRPVAGASASGSDRCSSPRRAALRALGVLQDGAQDARRRPGATGRGNGGPAGSSSQILRGGGVRRPRARTLSDALGGLAGGLELRVHRLARLGLAHHQGRQQAHTVVAAAGHQQVLVAGELP